MMTAATTTTTTSRTPFESSAGTTSAVIEAGGSEGLSVTSTLAAYNSGLGLGGRPAGSNLTTLSTVLTTATSGAFGTTTAATVRDFYQVEQLTFLVVLFAMIVIGNSTVLGALLMSKGHKSRMNFFIKHLAAADLSVGLFSVLTDIIWRITISWEAGLVACKFIRFLQCVVTYSSTYVLVALSIDRYDAITHPMNFSGSWKRARWLVAAAWVLSLLFSSPILFLYTIFETPAFGTQCWLPLSEPWQWQLYMSIVAVTLFFIPAILISACYIVIVVTIWKKGRAMATTAAAASSSNGGGGGNTANNRVKPSGGDDEPETRRASSRGLIPKAKVKTIKMTFVIIFVFILCWSPYMIFDLLQVFNCIPENKTTIAVATFIQSLAPLNSAANPLIYCLFSTNIGHMICNLLACRRRQAPILSTGMTTSTNSQSRPLINGHHQNLRGADTNSSSIRNNTAAGLSLDISSKLGDRPSVKFQAT